MNLRAGSKSWSRSVDSSGIDVADGSIKLYLSYATNAPCRYPLMKLSA